MCPQITLLTMSFQATWVRLVQDAGGRRGPEDHFWFFFLIFVFREFWRVFWTGCRKKRIISHEASFRGDFISFFKLGDIAVRSPTLARLITTFSRQFPCKQHSSTLEISRFGLSNYLAVSLYALRKKDRVLSLLASLLTP